MNPKTPEVKALIEAARPEPIQPVLLLSGGRTSGFMLRKQLDKIPDYREKWITIFCNTGKEMPQTLDFVHEIETRWEVPVIWLEYHRVPAISLDPFVFPTKRRNQNLSKAAAKGETVHWFKQVDYQTASRNGEPFDELLKFTTSLPNPVTRRCSTQLKIRTAMRYLFSIGVKEYSPTIGIRKDEEHRAIQILGSCEKNEHPKFPLIDHGITKHDVNTFWRSFDFDLGLQDYEGNCDLCFLKRKANRIRMAREHPERAKWWSNWERIKKADNRISTGAEFIEGQPYETIEYLAQNPEPELFDPLDLDIACSCAERGFGSEGDEL